MCLITCGLCFLYTLSQGWYLSGADIALILLDVLLLTLFGTALSSCLHYFLTTQGQMSAVGTLVGAGYGTTTGCAVRSVKWAKAAYPCRCSTQYATA